MNRPPWWKRRWLARLSTTAAPAPELPDALWLQTLSDYPFLKHRPLNDLQRLRTLSAEFLGCKEFNPVGGLTLTDAMALAVASQACVPILHLGLDAYDSFVGIVIQPAEVRVMREWTDEFGIVHSEEQDLAGEAVPGGPLMLSWPDVQQGGDAMDTGYNVVIHEFIHVLDAASGPLDGTPRLPDRATHQRWQTVIRAAFERHVDAFDHDRPTLIDPYGAHGIEEFFAVAAETFFVQGAALLHTEPALYAEMSAYFRQDPARYC